MSGRCESCEHWSFDEEFAELQPRRPRLDNPEGLVRGPWGVCGKVTEFGPHRGSDKFYVVDGSGYHAALSTRADFGCVEHEFARQRPTGDSDE